MFTAYLIVILKYMGSLYFAFLKGHSRSHSAILPELTQKELHYENVRVVVHGRGKDGMGRLRNHF